MRSTESFDIAIVGAGPAGSAAAIRLASAGRRVVLVERKQFPREKLCGEFVSPECNTHFEDLGVGKLIDASNPAAIDRTGFYSQSGREVVINSAWFGQGKGSASGLSRGKLDSVLAAKAEECGAEVRFGSKVVDLIHDSNRVFGISVRSDDGAITDIRAPLILDATGRQRAVSNLCHSENGSKRAARFVAFKTHLRNVDIEGGSCEIYVYPGGYGGCNSVEDGLVNICFVVDSRAVKEVSNDPGQLIQKVLFQNSRARKALANLEVAKPWISMPIENSPVWNVRPATGILAVGDAAAYIDPFTGSGILMALESGKVVSEAILNNGDDVKAISAAYELAYGMTFRKRLQISALLRNAAFRPRVSEFLISALSFSEGVARRIARATRSA